MGHESYIDDVLDAAPLKLRVELRLLEGGWERLDDDGLVINGRYEVGDLTDGRCDVVRRAGTCVVHNVDDRAPGLAETFEQCRRLLQCGLDVL